MILSLYLALVPAVSTATGQVLSTGSSVDHSHRLASFDTSLVVSGDVDCGRRRRNVYDKKPQHYAKDNRTTHLTARSNKSVACVTNNKILYSMFCTAEANYRQTQSIARLFCNSRATCLVYRAIGTCLYLSFLVNYTIIQVTDVTDFCKISKYLYLRTMLQLMAVWLTVRYRNRKDPRINPNTFL